jgi:hypothetical protein
VQIEDGQTPSEVFMQWNGENPADAVLLALLECLVNAVDRSDHNGESDVSYAFRAYRRSVNAD